MNIILRPSLELRRLGDLLVLTDTDGYPLPGQLAVKLQCDLDRATVAVTFLLDMQADLRHAVAFAPEKSARGDRG